jgi:hypothetical protein
MRRHTLFIEDGKVASQGADASYEIILAVLIELLVGFIACGCQNLLM